MVERKLTGVSAASIEPELTQWLWNGYIPLGSLTVLAGRQGLGKSTLALRLCSYVTRGKLPGDLKGEPRAVIYATAEDQLAATLVPRLIAAGADLNQVFFPKLSADGIPGTLNLPTDIPLLADLACEVGAAFVVIDPIVAFLGGKGLDAHRDQDVRLAFAPLAVAAEEHSFSLLSVMHLNKSTATADALTRISGSVAFTAAPRSVLLFGSEPSDPDGREKNRVLAPAKSNLAKLPHSRACQIDSTEVAIGGDLTSQPVMRIRGDAPHGAIDVIAATEQNSDERSARSEAKHFLQTELAEGPERMKVLVKRAGELGISQRTLERAKRDIGVTASQHHEDGDKFWVWSPPPERGK